MYILFFRYLNVILIHVSWDGWSLHDIIYTSCQLLISYCVGKKAIKSKPTWSPQYLISILLVVWYQIILELNLEGARYVYDTLQIHWIWKIDRLQIFLIKIENDLYFLAQCGLGPKLNRRHHQCWAHSCVWMRLIRWWIF